MELRDEIMEMIINKAASLFGKDASSLNENTNFTDDLGAKSVNLVQIIAVLEEEYDVAISFMEFRRAKTIGEAADYVASLC